MSQFPESRLVLKRRLIISILLNIFHTRHFNHKYTSEIRYKIDTWPVTGKVGKLIWDKIARRHRKPFGLFYLLETCFSVKFCSNSAYSLPRRQTVGNFAQVNPHVEDFGGYYNVVNRTPPDPPTWSTTPWTDHRRTRAWSPKYESISDILRESPRSTPNSHFISRSASVNIIPQIKDGELHV